MVESRSDHLDHVFRALAHPARRAILRQIARQEQTITELAAPFDMSLEAVSKHGHPRLVALAERAALHLEGDEPLAVAPEASPVFETRFRVGDQVIRTFTTVMRFEGAREITLSELRVELVFPNG